MTASLYKVKIKNMNECVNLRNIRSEWNTYIKSDIETLHNLKRIGCFDDKYKSNDGCLIEELFKKNKLEYIHVFNWNSNTNIVKSMTLSYNIANLRYMQVYQHSVKCDIKFNVSNEYPQHLRVYKVSTYQ